MRRHGTGPARAGTSAVRAVYIPDATLLAIGFIPGLSLTAVVALALMHRVVVGVAVPICLRLRPVR